LQQVSLSACQNQNMEEPKMSLLTRVQISEQQIIDWRHWLHRHPELSFQEFATTDFIENALRDYPNLTIERPIETGLVATLKGHKPGKMILLRADIDALPVPEESGEVFASENPGVSHACGHDTHTAMLMGAAMVLAQQPEAIAGTVKFLFQPAEEQPPGGAVQMVAAGVLEGVDEVYGIHVLPNKPAGSVGYSFAAGSAASDILTLTIHGKGAHAMAPDLAIDPITIGAEIIQSVNNMMARRVSPTAQAVVSWGQFTAGNQANVIPETAELKASIRTLNAEWRDRLRDMIITIIENTCATYGATPDIDYLYGYGTVENSHEPVTNVLHVARQVVGDDMIWLLEPMLNGEDFSAYTEHCPSAFFYIGAGLAEDGYGAINHNPKFRVDDSALINGTKMWVGLVDYLLGTN
jgi:amidohydrolase